MPDSIDTSIYDIKPTNPFGVMQGYAQTVGQLNQNMMFGIQLRARQKLGQIMQQSLNPDGSMNYDHAALLGSTDPDVAYLMPEIMSQWSQRRLTDLESQKTTLENNRQLMSAIGAQAGSLVATAHNKGNIVSQGELISGFANLKAQFPEHSDEFDRQLMALGTDPQGNPVDGRAVYDKLLNITQMAQIGERGLSSVLSNIKYPGAVPSGPSMGAPTATYGQANLAAGTISPTTGVGVQPQAGAAGETMLPQGAPGAGTAPPQGAGQGVGGTEYPVYPTQAAADAAGANAGGAPALPQGTVVTGLGPQQEQMLKDTTKHSQDLGAINSAASSTLTSIDQADRILNDPALKGVPGGGATWREAAGRAAAAVGAPKEVQDAISNGSLAGTQELKKILYNIGMQRVAELIKAGGGRLAASELFSFLNNGTANLDMQPESIKTILNNMREVIGYTRAESASFDKFRSSPSYGTPGNDVYSWTNRIWPQRYDQLRAYNQMTKEQRAKVGVMGNGQ